MKNLTYPYMGIGGVKNCQNDPYVINERPLINPTPNPQSGGPGSISIAPRDWVSVLVTSFDMHGPHWDYSSTPGTTLGCDRPTNTNLINTAELTHFITLHSL